MSILTSISFVSLIIHVHSIAEQSNVKPNGVSKLIQWGKPVETIYKKDFANEELFKARAMELKNFPKASHPHKLFSPGTNHFSIYILKTLF
jgi:hypothetical protein